MKKLSLLLAAAVLVFAGAASAHPPKDVKLLWNAADSTLTVTASHRVNDPNKHFVLSVSVFKGERQLVLKQYDRQDGTETFSDRIKLDGISSGDAITVRLTCNIMGETEAAFVIP